MSELHDENEEPMRSADEEPATSGAPGTKGDPDEDDPAGEDEPPQTAAGEE